MRVEYVWANVNFFQRFVVYGVQLAMFLGSAYYLQAGAISVGDLLALNGYAHMFLTPFVSLGYGWQTLQNGIVSAAKSEELFATPTEVYVPADAQEPAERRGAVEFRHVSFRYEGATQHVLEDVDVVIPGGTSIAFVGESGVGKSTTLGLISGHLFPTEGDVLVDGVSTRKYPLTALRSRMAVVPQEVALFNDTIRMNIRYGAFTATDTEVERAATEAQIHEYIIGLPDGYDTIVGERGVKLSVGQKQRIAIARAILRNPEVLILDEPTSALDAQTERAVSESLERMMKGRTTFIIAHRLSTVRKADMILVFEKGRIVESGSHTSLMRRKDGTYRKLYELQIGLHE